jgi:hypothetical protein
MYKPYDTHLFQPTKSEQIRFLNDAFRTTDTAIGVPLANGQLVITSGVAAHGNDFIDRAVSAVRRYRNFGPDNDPYGEHDFGIFKIDGISLNWKIDYYDENLEYGSPDPSDPAVTRGFLPSSWPKSTSAWLNSSRSAAFAVLANSTLSKRTHGAATSMTPTS